MSALKLVLVEPSARRNEKTLLYPFDPVYKFLTYLSARVRIKLQIRISIPGESSKTDVRHRRNRLSGGIPALSNGAGSEVVEPDHDLIFTGAARRGGCEEIVSDISDGRACETVGPLPGGLRRKDIIIMRNLNGISNLRGRIVYHSLECSIWHSIACLFRCCAGYLKSSSRLIPRSRSR